MKHPTFSERERLYLSTSTIPMAAKSKLSYEKDLDLALSAIKSVPDSSIRTIASLYNVSYVTLSRRLRGRTTRRDAQTNNRKLTPTEEQVLLDRIKSLDDQGFSPDSSFYTENGQSTGCITCFGRIGQEELAHAFHQTPRRAHGKISPEIRLPTS